MSISGIEASDQAVAILWWLKKNGLCGRLLWLSTVYWQSNGSPWQSCLFGKIWDLAKDVGIRRTPTACKHNSKASFLLPGEIHELIAVSDPEQPISYNTVCGKGSIVQAE